MICLNLFLQFVKIGLFSFGGAYGAIPLIKDVVLAQGWMDEAMFANVIAISESTPGPIMVNAATYIGSVQTGVPGALAATLGVVLPSFVIILLVSIFLGKWIKQKSVQCVLRGIKPYLMGIILATGCYMAYTGLMGKAGMDVARIDVAGLCILALLIAVELVYAFLKKKEFSPIWLIVLSAAVGIVLY